MLQLLIATHVLPAPVPDKANLPLGLWFVVLAYITISAALASLFEGTGLFAVLSTLAVGAAFGAIGLLTGGFHERLDARGRLALRLLRRLRVVHGHRDAARVRRRPARPFSGVAGRGYVAPCPTCAPGSSRSSSSGSAGCFLRASGTTSSGLLRRVRPPSRPRSPSLHAPVPTCTRACPRTGFCAAGPRSHRYSSTSRSSCGRSRAARCGANGCGARSARTRATCEARKPPQSACARGGRSSPTSARTRTSSTSTRRPGSCSFMTSCRGGRRSNPRERVHDCRRGASRRIPAARLGRPALAADRRRRRARARRHRRHARAPLPRRRASSLLPLCPAGGLGAHVVARRARLRPLSRPLVVSE